MILVTGGAGYIGSHTVRELVKLNKECIVVDNLEYGHIEAIPNQIIFEKFDLNDKKSLDNLFNKYKIEAVIHFAAYAYVGESVLNPQKYYQNNVLGTMILLEVMLKNNVKKIVFSSTCATYGNPQYTPIDENHPQKPINPYGHSKLMIEQILADYAKAYGLKYIALRYFNAAGAASDGSIGESHNPETHLIPLVLKAIKGENKKIRIFGDDYDTKDGTCIRDYIHVGDLATAHILALAKLDQYTGYINLGTGIGTTVMEVIKAAEEISGEKCNYIVVKRREGDPAALFAANKKAQSILGWEIKYNNIKDIIKSAWIWELNRKF